MTTIHLDESVAAALTAQAHAHGLSLDEYLKTLASPPAQPGKRLSAEEVIARIEAEAVPSQSNYRGMYPREDIYLDHD